MAIVGAGASGLLTALTLVDAQQCDPADIRIIDATVDTGRVCTHTTTAGSVLELGAGRISTVLHPRTWNLLNRFGVPVAPFNFSLRYHNGSADELAQFRNLDLHRLPDTTGFHESLVAALGSRAADRFCTLTGYEALRDPRLPRAAGIEIVSTHPESFQGTAFRDTWCAPTHGFGSLLDAVRQHLTNRGVRFMRSWRVAGVTTHRRAYRLHLLGDASRRAHVTADRVVFAMAPSDLDAIALPEGVDRPEWLDDVVSVPLFKGFLTYDEAWWNDYGSADTCLITSDTTQKVYFNSTSRTIFCYADSRNARAWQRVTAGGRSRVESEIIRRVATVSGLPLSRLAQFTDSACMAWPAGVSYLRAHRSETASGRIAPGIGLVSDALTSAPGWLEGSYQAADRAYDLLHDDDVAA